MKVLVKNVNDVVFDVSYLDILAMGMRVERQGNGYGKDAKYLPTKDLMDLELINDEQLITGEQDTIGILREKAKKAEEEKSAQWWKAYNAEAELEKLKKELAAIKSVCPHQEEEPAREPEGE